MPDSSEVLNAVVDRLNADAVLLGHMPDGAFEDEAPKGKTAFVIVSQVIATDELELDGRRAYEDVLLLVEARALSTTGRSVKAAAARIDAILDPEGQPTDLTVPGYALVTCEREEFVRGREVDVVDTSIRWLRRGGRYRIQVAPH